MRSFSWLLVSVGSLGLAGCDCGGDPKCGNGVAEGNEECDDKNDDPSDGCTSTCQLQVCGNARLEEGEGCDDGNVVNLDRCDAFCQPEPDPLCGNGLVERDEACDEGEANSDDQPNVCRTDCELPSCGDGVIDANEECDDGDDNQDAPSACRPNCVVPFCGDAIDDFDEGCDDANAAAGDGCDSLCFPEDVCGDRPYVNLMLDGIPVGNTIWFYGTTEGAENAFTPPAECPSAGDAPDAVHLYIAPNGGRVTITTRDATPAGDTQFDTIVYVLTDCDQGEADLRGCNDQYVLPEPIIDPWGPDVYEDDRAEVEISADPGEVFYIVVDGYDTAQAGGYALTVTQRPLREAGDDCDLSGALDGCQDGLVCSPVVGDPGHGTCEAAGDPVVTDASISVAGPWSLVFDVTGTDDNGDAARVLIQFQNILGDIVDVNFDGRGDENDFVQVDPDPGFIGLADFAGSVLVNRYERVVTADVYVKDLSGAQSAPFAVDVPDFPSPLGEGDACDPSGLGSNCGFGLACISSGGDFVCGEANCDGYVDMADHRDGAEWVYEGTTFGGTNTERCGETGTLSGDVGFSFTPSVGKTYRVAVEDASFSHVLSARANCEEIFDWFCLTGSRGVVTVQHVYLDAGRAFFFVVDGNLRAADEGNFTFRISDPIQLAAGEVCGPGFVDGVCEAGTICVDLAAFDENFCMEALDEGEACDPDSTIEYCQNPFSCAADGGGFTCQNLAFLGDPCGAGWGADCGAGLVCVAGGWRDLCAFSVCSATDINAAGVLDAGSNTVTYEGSSVGNADYFDNCSFPSGGDELLSYRTRQDAWVSFDTSGSEIDTALAASQSCTVWDAIYCNDDFGGVRSFIDYGWRASGTTIYLIVDDKYDLEADFTVTVREIPMDDPWGG